MMNRQFHFSTLFGQLSDPVEQRKMFKICVFVTIALLAARAQFWINPGWSVDTYSISVNGLDAKQLLSQGRFGQYILRLVLLSLGIDPVSDSTITQFLGLLLYGLITPLLLTSFVSSERLSIFKTVACSLLFLLHPYQAEILTFPEASFNVNFGIALGAGGFLLALNGGKRNTVIGTSLLFIALSIYQIVLHYVIITLIFGMLSTYAASTSDQGLRLNEAKFNIARCRSGAICIALAVATYVVSLIVLKIAVHADLGQRASFLTISDVPERFHSFTKLIIEQAKLPLIVDAPVASMIFGSAIFIGAFLWIKASPTGLFSLAAFALVGIVAATGLVLIGSVWWPVPRVLCGYPLVMTFIIISGWTLSKSKWIQGLFGILVIILITSFSSIGYTIHYDQHRLNRWDRTMADEILRDAENVVRPNDKVLTLSIVNTGMRWSHPVSLATTEGDMNISAFYVPSSLQGLFRESTGRKVRLSTPSSSDIEYCENVPKWPERGSRRYENGVVKFCI